MLPFAVDLSHERIVGNLSITGSFRMRGDIGIGGGGSLASCETTIGTGLYTAVQAFEFLNTRCRIPARSLSNLARASST
jgi:hypothetical protein